MSTTVMLVSPVSNAVLGTLTPTLTAQYDDTDSLAATSFTFETDITSAFNSGCHQSYIYTSVSPGDQKTWAPMLGNGFFYWRVAAVNSDGTIVSSIGSFTVSAGAIKRVQYQVENLAKYGPDWASKRVLYQYENIAKEPVWADKRTIYQYENVAKYGPDRDNIRTLYDYENLTSDPPFPTISRLSAYKVSQSGTLIIYGYGFGGKQAVDLTNSDRSQRGYGGHVYIGTEECGVTSWGWNAITILVPSDATTGALKVEFSSPSTVDSNLVGLNVTAQETGLNTGMELFVCQKANPNQIMAVLEGAKSRTFQNTLNAAGAGSFTISAQDPKSTAALLCNDNFVLCRIDGIDHFKWIMEEIRPTDVASGDQGAETIQVSGRGVLSLLARAVVYPSGMPTPASLDRAWTATPGAAILITLLQEAQERGTLTGISWDFTVGSDSLGNPWTDAYPVSFHAGTSLLDVVDKLTNGLGAFDIDITPNLKLQAYAQKGVDVSGKTIFRPGQGLLSFQPYYRSQSQINASLIEGSDGSIVEVSDPTSLNTYGRKEGYLQARDTPSTGLTAYGQTLLKGSSGLEWGVEAETDWEPYAPIVDYVLGDWIGVSIPAYDNKPEWNGSQRVVGYTITADDNTGRLSTTLNLNSIYLEKTIKLSQMQERLSQNSSSSSLTSQTTDPVSQKGLTTQLGNISHSSLKDLASDDHTQYFNASRLAAALPGLLSDVSSIKAAGQDSLTGDVILTAGSNVTLTQDSNARTITIAASEGGGGSSYQNAIDQPPSSPSQWDDEFESTSLNSKWSWLNQGTATATEENGFIQIPITPGGDHFQAIETSDLITEFDEGLWNATVDTMTVYSKKKIVLKLKDGTEIKWHI